MTQVQQVVHLQGLKPSIALHEIDASLTAQQRQQEQTLHRSLQGPVWDEVMALPLELQAADHDRVHQGFP